MTKSTSKSCVCLVDEVTIDMCVCARLLSPAESLSDEPKVDGQTRISSIVSANNTIDVKIREEKQREQAESDRDPSCRERSFHVIDD
jgi:hypothetical protein